MFDSYVNMATVGSLWFAATSFFVAIIVLIATIVIFLGQNKHTLEIRKLEADNKRLELEQRSFHNAMECFEIFVGLKGSFTDGTTSTIFQLAAAEALSNYMEYSNIFPFIRSFVEEFDYKNEYVKKEYLSAIDRLIVKSKNKDVQ